MGIFKRLFKFGQSEANAAIDKMEDPVKMTQQVIRDLEGQQVKAVEASAKFKANIIKLKANRDKLNNEAAEWKKKAIALLKKADSGELEKAKAEELATQAMNKSENATNEAATFDKQVQNQEARMKKINSQLKDFKAKINEARNDLTTLEARAESAKASKEIAKQMSDIGGTDTATAILERMKKRVEDDEAIADAYNEIDDETKDVSDEIDDILSGDSPTANTTLLANLRAEMEDESK